MRLRRLPVSERTASQPGLILIQIDGLSRTHFEAALRRGRMPFLRRLQSQEGYRLHTLYSGLPSSTPAVQGELFYGVKSAVPAFGFRDLPTRRIVQMIYSEAAGCIQAQLEAQGEGLLAEGSAYSNIYSGGAAEPRYCAATMDWNPIDGIGPIRRVLLMLRNAGTWAGMVLSLAKEFPVICLESAWGVWSGRGALFELQFIARYLAIAILLRDQITLGAEVDAARGLPVVQLNYLGYDEQAHHWGPGARSAHRTLRGIDRAIRRIWREAMRSPRRDYQVWIYADHGQETTIPYSVKFGRSAVEAINAVFQAVLPGRAGGAEEYSAIEIIERHLGNKVSKPREANPVTAAIGPVGEIYWTGELSTEEREQIASRLVTEAGFPLVFYREQDAVIARNSSGRFRLPEDAAAILGADHPFLDDAAHDLLGICCHRFAGEFVVCGWQPGQEPLSFVTEFGAHAGPGTEETRAFALLPPDIDFGPADYIRPLELREVALEVLGRNTSSRRRHARARTTFRIMTYNAHSCIGLDGKLSPRRIARVIAQSGADIVALQELDVVRTRTGRVDQATEIARILQMDFHFHPAIRVAEEQYGNAVLSRFPLQLVKAGLLPQSPASRRAEPRSVLWVVIEIDGRPVQVINTHFGLSARERQEQTAALLGPEWLQHPDCAGPVIVCGDFNTRPSSPLYARLRERLRDAQLCLEGHRPRATWLSCWAISRIDHIFVSDEFAVRDIDVTRSYLARVASDHLPLAVSLELRADSPPPAPSPPGRGPG